MTRFACFLVAFLVVVTTAGLADALINLDHIVGGRFGWRFPPNASYYQDWAANRTFVVGDKLVFMYRSGMQNVMQVPKEDFDKCTEDKILDWQYTGPTVLTLDKPGPQYYYCAIGTHCEAGQKLSIDVSATAVPDPARDGLGASSAPAHARGVGGVVVSAALLLLATGFM